MVNQIEKLPDEGHGLVVTFLSGMRRTDYEKFKDLPIQPDQFPPAHMPPYFVRKVEKNQAKSYTVGIETESGHIVSIQYVHPNHADEIYVYWISDSVIVKDE